MLNKIFWLMVCLFLMSSVCFAEVTREYDQFRNTFTIKSVKTAQLSDGSEAMVTLAKIYQQKHPTDPILSFTVTITSDRYHFFSKQFYYIINGEDLGRSEIWHTRNSSDPGLIVSTNAGRILNYSKIKDSIIAGKTITFRFDFSNALSQQIYLKDETIKEWQEVINFNLQAEIKKQEENNKLSDITKE